MKTECSENKGRCSIVLSVKGKDRVRLIKILIIARV